MRMHAARAPLAWARVLGDVGWWTFLVASLLGIAGIEGGMPRRYAEYLPSGDTGWTAYTPLLDDTFVEHNILATTALVGLVVTVLAAVAEAVLTRRWTMGIAGVAAAAAGCALVFLAAYWADPGTGTVQLRPSLVLVVCLIGVAVREGGVRWTRSRVDALSRSAPDAAPRPR
ncbi:hypothetical protein [Gordonia caeni]|uniref:DUF998 domain-containing protein n=1 Tax=Gordonia caeni TaxID=1007097 RepID=A0ABP7PLY3_9ACTN